MNFLPIVLTCDDHYFKYANVVMTSILRNRNDNCMYEINILSEYISNYHKEKALKQVEGIYNFQINFIDLKNIDRSLFFLNAHMTSSTYYRFYIPQIFKNYDRILYLDSDLIIDNDISALATMDFFENGEEKMVIACPDSYIRAILLGHVKISNINEDYFTNTLGIDQLRYFNAGVMLYNLQKMRGHDITEQLFNSLMRIKHPHFQDQDILNSVFSKIGGGGVKFISSKYNDIGRKHISKIQFISKYFKKYLGITEQEPLYYVYHFVGSNKPWKSRRLNYRLFYFYAIHSPFYKDILKENNTKFWF